MAHRVRVLDPPVLMGRSAELATIEEIARRNPGVVAVVGARGVGTSRVAAEATRRLETDGYLLIRVDGPIEKVYEQVSRALTALDMYPDVARASRIRPIVALAGDCEADSDEPQRIAEELVGSRAVVIVTSTAPPPGVSAVVLERLDDQTIGLVAQGAEPDLTHHECEWVASVAAGLPGRAISLASSARGGLPADEPVPLPEEFVAPVAAAVVALSPAARDTIEWLAVFPRACDARTIAALSSRDSRSIEESFDEIVATGLVEEIPPPGGPRWRFAEELMRLCVLQAMPASKRRLRATGALVLERGRNGSAELLLSYALLARNQNEVVRLAAGAAEQRLRDGDATGALEDAERGLRWHEPQDDERHYLDALCQRGLALSELARWDEAVDTLDEAARGYAALDRDEDALIVASAASSALWMLGRHGEALDCLTDHLDEREGQFPNAARAEALTQAAGIAAATSLFARGRTLAERARTESELTESRESATRALIFRGMSEVGATGTAELTSFTQAIDEARTGQGSRNETLALIHMSHALLLLGRPKDAEAAARNGVDRAATLGIEDHRLVLEGNLGDALIARGALGEARHRLEVAAQGWRGLGRDAPTPADPGIAWLYFAKGDPEGAAKRYTEMDSESPEDEPLFELAAPVGAGHAWAKVALGQREGAEGIVARHLELWRRGDDRLAVVPLAIAGVAAGGSTGTRCAEIVRDLGASGSALAAAFIPLVEGYSVSERSPAAAADQMRTTAEALDELGYRWWSVFALFLAGSHADDGGDLLLKARQGFREMGADNWRLRAEGELRARGRRIPSRTDGRPSTPGGLSSREMDVLQELARGLTNREIGERLFISERTVARHVGNILAKLAVKNRTSAVREGRQRGILRI